MTLKEVHWEPIYPYLEQHLKFLNQEIKKVDRNNKFTRVGINASIIIISACCIEGKIEEEIKNLINRINTSINQIDVPLNKNRRIKNVFTENMTKYFQKSLEKTSGIENYNHILRTISIARRPIRLKSYPKWEGIKILFYFRNMLAHGREIRAERTLLSKSDEKWSEDFIGGYKLTEDYLIRNKLISKRFFDGRPIEKLLTSKVSRHFYSLSKNFIKYSRQIFENELREIK